MSASVQTDPVLENTCTSPWSANAPSWPNMPTINVPSFEMTGRGKLAVWKLSVCTHCHWPALRVNSSTVAEAPTAMTLPSGVRAMPWPKLRMPVAAAGLK
ncbi:hypothetical protein D9M72_647450 [compost metagenome]